MFICNLKVDKNSLSKIIIGVCSIICLSLMVVAVYKIYQIGKNSDQDECLPKNGVAVISDKNYTNILKMVHEDLDTYVGQEISYTRICV